MRRTRILIVLLPLLLLSLVASYPLTRMVGDLPVDIGLDFSTDEPLLPGLVWLDANTGQEMRVDMVRVPDQYAPRLSRFEVTPTGEKNPDSSGYEIALRTLPEKRIVERMTSIPEHQWHIEWAQSLTFGDSPSTLAYEEMGGPVTLEFHRAPWSGVASVRSFELDESIDLYGQEGAVESVLLPYDQWSRYQARVPRRSLGDLTVQFSTTDAPPPIERLYIATVVPSIFFSGRIYPDALWGRVIRDWSPSLEAGRLVVPATGLLERGGAATFSCIAGFVFVLACGGVIAAFFLFALLKYLWRLPPVVPRELAPFSWRLFGVLFVAHMLVMSIYLAMYYPGMENGDIRMQLEETRTGEYHDNHPVVHTLFIGALRAVRDSWDIVAVSQMTMLAGVLSAAFAFLVQLRAPRYLWGVVVLVGLFSPRIGTMSVSIWKDVPYAVLLLLLTLLVARFFLDERVRSRWTYWVSLSLVLGLIPLIRHNGAALPALMAPVAILCFAPYRARALGAVSLSVGIFLAVKFMFYPMILTENYGGDATPDFWVKAKTLRDSRLLLANDPPIRPQEYAALESVRILNPEDNVLLFGTDRFGVYDKHRAYNYKHAVSEAGLVQETRVLVTSMLWRYPLMSLVEVWLAVRLPRAEFLVRRHDNIQLGFWVPFKRTYDLAGTWDDALHARFVEMRKQKAFIYSQPALSVYIVLLAALICWWRSREPRLLAVYAPVLVNTLAVAAVAASASDRYHLPLELSAGFLVCFALLPWSERNDHALPETQRELT